MSEAEAKVATHESQIPPAVQKQLDEVRALHDKAQAKSVEQVPAQVNTEAPAPVDDGNTEAPAHEDAGPKPLTVPTPQEVTPQDMVPQDTPEVTDISTLPKDIQKRLHAYDVLKGKYSKEVPELQSQLRKSQAKAEMLEDEVEKAKTAHSQTPSPQSDIVTPDMITDEDLRAAGVSKQAIEDYGEEYWKQQIAVQRNQMRPYMQQVQQMQSVATPEQAQKEEDTFYTSLDSLTPEWRELNNSRAFAKWLDTPDPVYGVPYIDMLQDAASDNDAIRASAIFSLYKQQLAQHAPTTPAPPAPTPQPVTLPSVQSQVALPSAPQAPDNGKPTYPASQWRQMMVDLTTGKYTPERRTELKKELDAAVREQRVYPG